MQEESTDTPYSKCVLKCANPKGFFKFPLEREARQLWLDRLGLDSVPGIKTYARICRRHFSPSMLTPGGRKLTETAVPDMNFPGCDDLNFLNKPEPKLDSQLKVITPNTFRYNMNIDQIPRIVMKPIIMTSENSICFLKCKNANMVHKFPKNVLALGVWLEQLDMDLSTRIPRTAGLCQNHFSSQMTTTKGLRNCAIPDLCLPKETTFKPAEGEQPTFPICIVDDDQKAADSKTTNVIQGGQSVMFPEGPLSEILINPIENIKNVLSTNKEGILHVYQPNKESQQNDDVVALPENYIDGEYECVLKCPNAERLFRFPNIESKRQQWLKKIGLTHCFFNTRICGRHFSDSMFLSSRKRLTKAAYPDMNIPVMIRMTDDPLALHQNEVSPQTNEETIVELPQYIFVLTVLTRHTELEAVVNGTKFIKHTVDKTIPIRDRGNQVEQTELVQKVNVAIMADEDFSDDFEMPENINYEEQKDSSNMFKDYIFTSKIGLHECLICGEISIGQDANEKHQKLHHNEKSLLCPQCGQLFSQQEMLKEHEIEEHLGQSIFHRCPHMLCKKAFYSKKKLDWHLDEHLKPKKLNCKNCHRLFFSVLKLRCHQKVCKLSFRFSK